MPIRRRAQGSGSTAAVLTEPHQERLHTQRQAHPYVQRRPRPNTAGTPSGLGNLRASAPVAFRFLAENRADVPRSTSNLLPANLRGYAFGLRPRPHTAGTHRVQKHPHFCFCERRACLRRGRIAKHFRCCLARGEQGPFLVHFKRFTKLLSHFRGSEQSLRFAQSSTQCDGAAVLFRGGQAGLWQG